MKRLLLLFATALQFIVAQTITFNPTGFGKNGTIQQYVVPGCGNIHIDAYGAQGGNTNGGRGAYMSGNFSVDSGDTLFIVVGQQGVVNSCGGPNASAGGGGGSFVWKNSGANRTLLIVAGGGGGGNMNWGSACTNGIDAVTTHDGTQGNGSTSAMGGTGGNGGAGNAPSGTGSGGTGWLSNGENSTYGSGCTGGLTYPFFIGGDGSDTFGSNDEGDGGFGGGGGAVCGNGGGGGYSGGGGGEGSSCRAGGGGGGSYNAGTNQVNTAGIQTGDGAVVFNVTLSVPNSNILSASILPNDTVCVGTNVTASGLNGSSFNWNNGITNGVPFVATNPMNLQLIGNDTLGCLDTMYIDFHVNPLPTVSYMVAPDDTVCSGTMVTASGTGASSYSWTNGITDNVAFEASGSSTYIVTGTDINGCTNTSTLNVTVNTNPSVNLGGTVVQANPPATLDAGIGFSSYNWSNSQTTQTISVGTNGSYWVIVEDANGCTTSDTVDVFFTAGTEGNETILSNVKIYPNPASEIINISLSDLNAEKISIEIFNMQGSCVYSTLLGEASGSQNYAINLAEFSPGNYTVRLTTGSRSASVNIIKK